VTKFVRYDQDRTGVLVDGRVLDIVASLDAFAAGNPAEASTLRPLFPGGESGWIQLIESWDRAGHSLRALIAWCERTGDGVTTALDGVRLRPPLTGGRVFALGANFRSHVESASKAIGLDNSVLARIAAAPPGGFFVIPGSVVGPGDDFTPPEGAERIDYEAELAVVLASGGRRLDPGGAAFWGYTGWNDLSVRDPHLGVGLSGLDKGSLSWALQKNWEGGHACGAYMVVGEGDPTDIRLESRVNGEMRQSGSTSEMIHSFGDAVAYLSQFLTLRPGDTLLSGTPAGTAIESGAEERYLQPGDVVEVEAGEAGVLRNRRSPEGAGQ
jgi:2-keto-4-pentenoate hydratase/2-oxohepta-3-ene-1,7-dioic acid hydratase in catechol pathway